MRNPEGNFLGKAVTHVLLLATLAFGFGLRFNQLDVSLWGDEIQTYERSVDPVGYMLTHDQYPLYHLVAHGMLHLGDNEIILRLPSLIAGMATIIVLFLVVRTLYNSTAGLVAAFLLAASPYHVYHSQYARYYAFMMLFGLLAMFFLHLALTRHKWRYWWLYSLCGAAGGLSQLVFLPPFIAMGIGAGLWILCSKASRREGRIVRSMAILFAFASLALLPSIMLVQPTGALRLLAKTSPEGATTAGTAQAAQSAPPQQEKKYYLRILDQGGYIEFFKRYFWMESPWVWKLLLVFGVWGLVDLFRYRTRMAALIVSIIVLPPIPFLYLPVTHWHHDRYYCAAYIPALILVCIGMMVLPTFLANAYCNWRGRKTEAEPGGQGRSAVCYRVAEALLIGGILAALFPVAKVAWDTYPIEDWLTKGPLIPIRNPRHDWKGLYAYMADSVRPGDIVHYGEGIEYVPKYRRLYLDRFLNKGYALELNEIKNTKLTPDFMKELCLKYPLRNLWFTTVFEFAFKPDFRLFHDVGAEGLSFVFGDNGVGTMLFVLGEPTVNLVQNGSFEPDEPDRVPAVDPVPRNEVFQGQGSLRISVPKERPATSFKTLNIMGLPYRVRNAYFDVWKGDAPAGWEVAPNAASSVYRAIREKSASPCIGFRASSGPVAVNQLIPMGLASSRRVTLDAVALARQKEQAALILKYDVPGRTERVKAYHSGNGAWEPLRVTTTLPQETNPDTISIELLREPVGEGEVCFDDVTVAVQDAGNMLDPRLAYTLSMMVKHEHITRADLVLWEKGFVRMSYAGADGNRQEVTLGTFKGTRDWFQFVASVIPGGTLPSDAKEPQIEIGIDDGSGTLIVDNVQFEPKDHVTPFTEGVRLPHDESLALRGLLQRPK